MALSFQAVARLRADSSHENERTKAKGSRVSAARQNPRFFPSFPCSRVQGHLLSLNRVIVTSIFHQLVREGREFFTIERSKKRKKKRKGKSPKKKVEKRVKRRKDARKVLREALTSLWLHDSFTPSGEWQAARQKERETKRAFKVELAESHENTMPASYW